MRHNGDSDDYGLPHVDVVVPDDARDLDQDLHAWRREERRRRHGERLRRLLRPFTRFGPAAPLIAGALLIALISGTMMTVFGPRAPQGVPSAPLASQPTVPPGQVGGPVPDPQVTVSGAVRPASELRPAVIAIMPTGCQCADALERLARQAQSSAVKFYVVAGERGAGDSAKEQDQELRKITGGLREGPAIVIDDPERALAAGYQAKGLTVVTVHIDGITGQVLRETAATATLDLYKLRYRWQLYG